jgi:hypothetical protein
MFRYRVANVPIIWEGILQLGLNDWCCKSLKAMLCRLALGFVAYIIWCTRNEIKHAGHPKSEEQSSWEIKVSKKQGEPCALFFVESACRSALLIRLLLVGFGWLWDATLVLFFCFLLVSGP